MCDPISAATAALSVAGTAASYVGAQSKANETNDAYEANAAEVRRAAGEQYASLAVRQNQTQASLEDTLLQQRFEAMKAEGTARASAAEAGGYGQSFHALLGDLMAQAGRQTASVEAQYDAELLGLKEDAKAIESQGQNRINSAPRAKSPAVLPYLISGATGVLGSVKGSPSVKPSFGGTVSTGAR